MTSRELRDSETIRVEAFNRRLMAEFQTLLDENLSAVPLKPAKFRAKLGAFRQVMEWQQVEPLSAMGKFYVRGHVVAASFYFHGLVPEMDEAVLEATEALFASWFGADKASQTCRGLRSITERPVLVLLPSSNKLLSPDDWRIISNLCPCLAAVFFERAEAAIQQIETYLHSRGFRKGGTATAFLRN